MRIVAGELRGTRLAAVGKGDAVAHLRPTTDRVRESLFNILQGGAFGDPISDAVVLDLFAGTGALGFEALSRGADHVTFVDDGRASQRLIAENQRLTRSNDRTRLMRCNALKLPALGDQKPATLVFMDPPYGKDLGGKALVSSQGLGWIAPGALVVWEESAPQDPPSGFSLLQHRRYGESHITFVEAD